MDGPVHFIPGATGLDEMPLTATLGEARVIQIEHSREITADEIRQHRLYRSDGAKVHNILLQAGIWIIEGLDLSPVTGHRYEMICLPVKLHGSDGAAARVILRPLRGHGQAVSAEAAP
jgi:kynurenine formamidase